MAGGGFRIRSVAYPQGTRTRNYPEGQIEFEITIIRLPYAVGQGWTGLAPE